MTVAEAVELAGNMATLARCLGARRESIRRHKKLPPHWADKVRKAAANNFAGHRKRLGGQAAGDTYLLMCALDYTGAGVLQAKTGMSRQLMADVLAGDPLNGVERYQLRQIIEAGEAERKRWLET